MVSFGPLHLTRLIASIFLKVRQRNLCLVDRAAFKYYLENMALKAKDMGAMELKVGTVTHEEAETCPKITDNDSNLPAILEQFSAEELKRMETTMVRKLDFRILPILVLLFILNILDRNTIAHARLGGLQEGLELTDHMYQTALMVMWAGYISMMIPSNMMLSLWKPKIFLPTVVIAWGVVCAQ